MSKLQIHGEFQKFQSCVVFPVVSEDNTIAYQFAGKGDKLNPLAYPICLRDIHDLKTGTYCDALYDIKDADCAENSVLIRHPFRPYQLIPLDTSEEQIINDHLTDLKNIFEALGAKSVSEKVTIEEQQTLEIDAKGRLKIKMVKGNGDFKSIEEIKQDSNLELNVGRIPGEDAGYTKANAIAQKYNITENSQIARILRAFDPDRGGKDKIYFLDEELSSEYHKRIDVACNVNAANIFNFKGKFNKDIKRYRLLRISTHIEFV